MIIIILVIIKIIVVIIIIIVVIIIIIIILLCCDTSRTNEVRCGRRGGGGKGKGGSGRPRRFARRRAFASQASLLGRWLAAYGGGRAGKSDGASSGCRASPFGRPAG